MQDLPNSLAVMGSSSIGLELAQAMARLGVEVSLFDKGDRLGGVRCDKVHAALKTVIEDDLRLVLNAELKPSAADAGIRIEWSGDSSGDATFDYALVATGRPPNLDSLNLAATGLTLDDNGVPEHDRETMQCGDSPIILAGDAGLTRRSFIKLRTTVLLPAAMPWPFLPRSRLIVSPRSA